MGARMRLFEDSFAAAVDLSRPLLGQLEQAVQQRFDESLLPIRLVVNRSSDSQVSCEIGLAADLSSGRVAAAPSIFDIRRRAVENTSKFTTVLIVPTGIGAEVGGHAGDATPVARLLGSVADTLVTHPNVVNASDINEIPENGLYVEGSLLTRMLMGTIGLQPVRTNRILAIIDEHEDPKFTADAINSVNAARATLGTSIPTVVRLDPPLAMSAEFSASGRAMGRIEAAQHLLQVIDENVGDFDAIALSTQIRVPLNYHVDYYEQRGEMINPWGGVEAILTHGISTLYGMPSAHAPMLESEEVADLDLGLVESRMASEAISIAFFICALKGLQRAPRVVTDPAVLQTPGVLSAEDVSCLVIPDGVLGMPVIAALEQRIPVIAVRESANLMRNDLTVLPWAPGQLHIVENYWEAAGVMAALKAGLDPAAMRRPFPDADTLSTGEDRLGRYRAAVPSTVTAG
jgi:hypothetical protein